MWTLLRSEYQYHFRLFLGFLIIIPFFWLFVQYLSMEDLPLGMLVFVMLFLMLQNWFSFRAKDKRERQQALLPLSNFQIALARTLIVIFSTLAYAGIHFGTVSLVYSINPFDFPFMMKVCTIIIIGFSLAFVFRDIFSGLLRRIGVSKNSVWIGTILLILGLNLLGLFFFQVTDVTGQPPIDIKPLVLFIAKSNPFSDKYGFLKFLGWTGSFTALTVVTFRWRESYIN